jgi:hypothetical protein
MMKSKLIMLVLIVVAAALSAMLMKSAAEKRVEKERHAVYESILREYSMALRPGTPRNQVEAMLDSRGRSFQQMCCLLDKNRNRNALQDLVRIGSEPMPWYCNPTNMYLVFEFDSLPDPRSLKAHPDDTLRKIALSPGLQRCL